MNTYQKVVLVTIRFLAIFWLLIAIIQSVVALAFTMRGLTSPLAFLPVLYILLPVLLYLNAPFFTALITKDIE